MNTLNLCFYRHAFLIWLLLLFAGTNPTFSKTIKVGAGMEYSSIKLAIKAAVAGDTLIIFKAVYKEGNIIIDKPLVVLGENRPVLDGEKKYEVISVKASDVTIKGLQIQNSGHGTLHDPGAIKVYDADNITIEDNELVNNFFGIYIQYGKNCIIRNNTIKASQKEEYNSGNGIHSWKSDSLQIIGNKIEGHRDGIYFEFVTNTVIWRNISKGNLRYGLHFMFSNDNAYIGNYFKNNGAGVAVMFTKRVTMMNNTFEENWGDAAYGALFKEITDCFLLGNTFVSNTTGLFLDGSNRIRIERNRFLSNGWGMRLQASCVDNEVLDNNFMYNTFDVATNGSLILNTFNNNFWDKYEGYDLNRDGFGDVPFRPLSLFSVIVEKNPPAMLMYRSFMISLLDKSEKLLPSLTPEQFIDNSPRMKPFL